ncbi:hypothetical protein BKA81DRAFT_398598 [Phyllosticta paracitricarpa]
MAMSMMPGLRDCFCGWAGLRQTLPRATNETVGGGPFGNNARGGGGAGGSDKKKKKLTFLLERRPALGVDRWKSEAGLWMWSVGSVLDQGVTTGSFDPLSTELASHISATNAAWIPACCGCGSIEAGGLQRAPSSGPCLEPEAGAPHCTPLCHASYRETKHST